MTQSNLNNVARTENVKTIVSQQLGIPEPHHGVFNPQIKTLAPQVLFELAKLVLNYEQTESKCSEPIKE